MMGGVVVGMGIVIRAELHIWLPTSILNMYPQLGPLTSKYALVA